MLITGCLTCPVYAQQILIGVIVKFQIALICIIYSFANASCQMDIGRCHQCSPVFFFDSHDAIKRMLGPFSFFHVVHNVHDLLAMSSKEFPVQGNEAGRKIVVDTLAGRARFLMGSRRGFTPLPAPFLEQSAALRTYSRLWQLMSCPVRVMYTLLEELVVAGNLA